MSFSCFCLRNHVTPPDPHLCNRLVQGSSCPITLVPSSYLGVLALPHARCPCQEMPGADWWKRVPADVRHPQWGRGGNTSRLQARTHCCHARGGWGHVPQNCSLCLQNWPGSAIQIGGEPKAFETCWIGSSTHFDVNIWASSCARYSVHQLERVGADGLVTHPPPFPGNMRGHRWVMRLCPVRVSPCGRLSVSVVILSVFGLGAALIYVIAYGKKLSSTHHFCACHACLPEPINDEY